MPTVRLSYYPWITQHITPAELDTQVKNFAGVFEQELRSAAGSGNAVSVLQPLDVPAQIEQLVAGMADLALMNPLGFVFARSRSAAIGTVAVAQRKIDGKPGTTYYAQLYTHKKTGIRAISQAAQHTLAFGAKFSTSNFLIPALELRSKGLHPLTAFSSVMFLGGHDTVAKAVYDGRVDLGAGHDGVIADLSSQYGYGDAADCLVQLLRSAPIPSDPIALQSKDSGWAATISKSLVAASQRPEGQAALARFWGGVLGLEAIDSSAYDTLMQATQILGLGERDILG